jgi:hypothetical protein
MTLQQGNGGEGRAVDPGRSGSRAWKVGGRQFSLEITGLDRLEAMLLTARREANTIVGRAVNEEVQLIAAAAQSRTPKRHGYLRGSQQILGPISTSSSLVESAIVYGNTSAWYAMLVHEREFTSTGKPINYRVGGAKYLSKTVDAALPVLGDRIGARVQAILDGLI